MAMKKRIFILICFFLIGSVLIYLVMLKGSRKNVDGLVAQLEDAINKHSIEGIVELFPDYNKSIFESQLSQSKLDDFYNNVIANSNNIQIEVVSVSEFDLSKAKEIQYRISQNYGQDIEVQDYQLLMIKYHQDFAESVLEVIKIAGEYYLYVDYYIPAPIQYFIE